MWKKLLSSSLILYILYKLLKKKRHIPDKNDKRVVIIGSSSGIGKQLALEYAKRGTQLVLIARRLDLLETLKMECEAANSATKVFIHSGDATVETCARQMAEFTKDKLKGCDVLIISMGVTSVSSFDELCKLKDKNTHLEKVARDIFNTNFFGPMLCIKHFMNLLDQSKGKLVPISSLSGVFAGNGTVSDVVAPNRSLYTASKHALNGFIDSLRMELKVARSGVSVINVMPGTVATEFRQSALDATHQSDKKALHAMTVEECCSQILVAIDSRQRQAFIPFYYHWVWALKSWIPGIIDRGAIRRYT